VLQLHDSKFHRSSRHDSKFNRSSRYSEDSEKLPQRATLDRLQQNSNYYYLPSNQQPRYRTASDQLLTSPAGVQKLARRNTAARSFLPRISIPSIQRHAPQSLFKMSSSRTQQQNTVHARSKHPTKHRKRTPDQHTTYRGFIRTNKLHQKYETFQFENNIAKKRKTFSYHHVYITCMMKVCLHLTTKL
jgi:hypothetical protein